MFHRHPVLHILLLTCELSIFFFIGLCPICHDYSGLSVLIHHTTWLVQILLSFGCTFLVIAGLSWIGTLRLERPLDILLYRRMLAPMFLIAGILLMTFGGRLLYVCFPELFRSRNPCSISSRLDSWNAVKVSFNSGVGICSGETRVVINGKSYGENLNLFPSDDERNFKFYRAKIHLPSNTFYVDDLDTGSGARCLNFFCKNPIDLISEGESWTYVLDVANFEGALAGWYVGQTWGTNNNDYVCLTVGNFGRDIKAGDKKFLRLKGTPWKERNMLDRAFIALDPEQHVKVEFRVSLFAGTGVNESNYHYVRPGETIACPLPVPTREGYEFEGWYDGERRVTETTKVEKREEHTLTARWRKL